MKILIVEDEPDLAKAIAKYLTELTYVCEMAHNFELAIEKIASHDYDCVLLDIMLPGGDGLRILEQLKKMGSQSGVIIISAKNALEDKVKGLELGADDYLAKPFHLSELAARIFSLMRRKQFDNSNVVVQEHLKIDLLAKAVFVHDVVLALTKKEFDLLVYLIGNKNRVVSKSALAEHLSGDLADMFDNHDFVYAHIKNLKKKLADAGCNPYLKTIYGTGYKWEK